MIIPGHFLVCFIEPLVRLDHCDGFHQLETEHINRPLSYFRFATHSTSDNGIWGIKTVSRI